MTHEESVIEVHLMMAELKAFQKARGWSSEGEVLWQSLFGGIGDEMVIVEANGDGTAVLRIVEGNYPNDFTSLQTAEYATEDEATTIADEIHELQDYSKFFPEPGTNAYETENNETIS